MGARQTCGGVNCDGDGRHTAWKARGGCTSQPLVKGVPLNLPSSAYELADSSLAAVSTLHHIAHCQSTSMAAGVGFLDPLCSEVSHNLESIEPPSMATKGQDCQLGIASHAFISQSQGAGDGDMCRCPTFMMVNSSLWIANCQPAPAWML